MGQGPDLLSQAYVLWVGCSLVEHWLLSHPRGWSASSTDCHGLLFGGVVVGVGTGRLLRGGLDTLLGPEETGCWPLVPGFFRGVGPGFFSLRVCLLFTGVCSGGWGVSAGTILASYRFPVWWGLVACGGWCCLFFENCTVDASIFVSLLGSAHFWVGSS